MTAEVLQSYRREDLPLWNWYSLAFPNAGEWRAWLNDVAGQLLRQPGPSRARVVKTNVVESGQAPERISFDGLSLGIGRAADNAVVLPESTITRQHARLRREGDAILLEDLGSAMGTLINGAKLTPSVPVELAHGDRFVIFPYRFSLEVEREWVGGQGADVSDPEAAVATWSEFLGERPAGWCMLPVRVEPIGASAVLAAEQAFLRRLAARLLAPVEASEEEWQGSSEALIELLLLAALERANRDLAFPFQFSLGRIGRVPRLAPDARGVSVAAVIDLAEARGAVRLFLPFDLLHAMQERWKPRRADGLAAQAAWRFAFSVGHVELNAEEQRSIEPGDVVLYAAEPALLAPGDDRTGFLAEWDGAARARLREAFDRRVGMANEAVPFHELPVRVQVLVDEHELTLSQAEALAPGAVLDLNRDPRDPVRLAVNGRVVGTGELVEIEGRLGVKILAWSKR